MPNTTGTSKRKTAPVSPRRKRATAGGQPEPPITPAPAACRKPIQFSEFPQQWRDKVDGELKDHFDNFLADGFGDDKEFLIEAFEIWESQHAGDSAKGFDAHDMPLLSSISAALNNEYLVKVDSAAMVAEVEEFITRKLESGWKPPVVAKFPWNDPADVIAERTRKLLMRHVDYFTYNCDQGDMVFLIDMLEQWETIIQNPELRKGTNHKIAAAAELQLELDRRREERYQEMTCRQAAQKKVA